MNDLFITEVAATNKPALIDCKTKNEVPTFTEWSFEEIDKYIETVLIKARKLFNFNYGNFTISKNKRFKSVYARCWFEESHIEFSKFLLERYSDDFVKSVIVHEMCHALSYQFDGKESGIDHAHDKVFKNMCRVLCKELGVPDGSKAYQIGETRQELIEKYNQQEKNNVLITVGKYVEIIIDIVIKKTVNVFIKNVDVETSFLISMTPLIYNDS